jgi:hypothetical protein
VPGIETRPSKRGHEFDSKNRSVRGEDRWYLSSLNLSGFVAA